MIVTELRPITGGPFDVNGDGARARLDGLYATPRAQWLRINLVVSINGNAAGSDGTSATLTVGADRKILGAIRRNSDLVLVGASSVRLEGYFLPKSAPLAIVTGTGDLTGHQIPADIVAHRVLVLCPPEAVAVVKATVSAPVDIITLPGPTLQVADAVTALRERGFDRIVCEGGPGLAAQLVSAGVVDELCLSTSPQLNVEVRPAFPGLETSHALELNQLLIDTSGGLYARWALEGVTPAP